MLDLPLGALFPVHFGNHFEIITKLLDKAISEVTQRAASETEKFLKKNKK
jgi:hypothetical protein